MNLSLFVLALWVFLQSSVQLAWFMVDQKLIGFIGMVFVVIVVLEALFFAYRGHPLLSFHHRDV